MDNYEDDYSDNETVNNVSVAPAHEGQNASKIEDLCSLLIPMHNQLVDVFGAVDNRDEEFNLPVIVVVGSQSAGKSSVLESLVNRQFLPRGDGLVTRCPIELRLYQTKRSGDDTKEWAEFGHDTTKKKWSFNKIENEIKNETNRLAGGNKGIVATPITLSVFSPNVIPLTVVDLPGIVKNSTGDQPEDIEDQINNLIYEYISKPSTIILAISAANNDIATSESLKLARRVDPQGERTLGVITKIDKAERDSEELKRLLTGEIIELKYGFIGVRNHSLDELKKNKSMDLIREEEQRILEEIVPDLASENGTNYLANKLSQLLVRHICKRLPGLENKIAEELKFFTEKIQTLGSDDIPNKSKTMSTTIQQFCTRFNGEFEGRSRRINTTYLSGGAQVKFAFLNRLEEALAAVDPLEDITNDDIAKAILSSGAMESSVSVPEAAYQHLVKTQIKKLLPPCLECVRDVHKELQSTVEDCLDPQITFRFPRLTEHLVGAVHKFLSSRLTKVIETLRYHIEIEAAFISTSREDFRAKLVKLMADKNITDTRFAQSVLNPSAKRNERALDQPENVDIDEAPQTNGNDVEASGPGIEGAIIEKTIAAGVGTLLQTGNLVAAATSAATTAVTTTVSAVFENGGAKELEAEIKATSSQKKKRPAGTKSNASIKTDDGYIVRSLIQAYFEIVRQSIRDYVPKLLTHSIIYYACDNLQVYLIEQLHLSDKIDDLVRVSEEASKQRVHARGRLQRLKRGEEIIKQIRQSIQTPTHTT